MLLLLFLGLEILVWHRSLYDKVCLLTKIELAFFNSIVQHEKNGANFLFPFFIATYKGFVQKVSADELSEHRHSALFKSKKKKSDLKTG